MSGLDRAQAREVLYEMYGAIRTGWSLVAAVDPTLTRLEDCVIPDADMVPKSLVFKAAEESALAVAAEVGPRLSAAEAKLALIAKLCDTADREYASYQFEQITDEIRTILEMTS